MASNKSAPGSTTTPTPDSEDRLPMPSRNPLPLSASQEAQIRDIYYARVRSRCADEIKGSPPLPLFLFSPLTPPRTAFADCALGRTFSVAFKCRDPHRVMNSCMKIHATQEEQDGAREDWFAARMERQRERERKARRKAEQEAFLREWWGLPEKDRELARKEMERMKQPQRIGGFASKERRVLGENNKEGER